MATKIEEPLIAFGAYVTSLNVSLGWGGQGGTMQLKLVEDPDNDILIQLPAVGTAVYFKYEGMYFGGVLQRWTYNENISGRTYDVIIESPSKLMDGVQLIIENFNGATDQWAYTKNCSSEEWSTNVGSAHLLYADPVYNVYNIFGYYENPVHGSGSPYNNFGNSGFNDAGMQVNKILAGLTNVSKRKVSKFAGPVRFGKEKSSGGGGTGGPGIPGNPGGSDAAGFSEYTIDVTELRSLRSSKSFGDYRLKGPVKSVNTIIAEMADLFQFDFFYTIEPEGGIPSENGGGPIGLPTIKVKVLDRSEPPDSGKVAEFVEEKKEEGNLISYQLGREFGDTVTQKIVWGANRSRYLKLEVEQGFESQFYAVFGRLDVERPETGTRPYNIPLLLTEAYDSPPVFGNPFAVYLEGQTAVFPLYNTSTFELRMALGGKESWQIFKTFQTLSGKEPNGYNNIFRAPWAGAFDNTNGVIQFLAGGKAATYYDVILSNPKVAAKLNSASFMDRLDRLYSSIASIARTSYGQEFFLLLPTENSSEGYNFYDPVDQFNRLKTWDIAASGFDTRPLVKDISCYDGNGKVTSLVGYPRDWLNYWATSGKVVNPDFSVFGSDYAYGFNHADGNCDYSSYIFTKKGSPEPECYWGEDNGITSGQWGVIFKSGVQVKAYDGITTPDYGFSVLAKIFFNVIIPGNAMTGAGKPSIQFAIPPDVVAPRFFGVPQESSRFRWGPWVTDSGAKGFATTGKAQAEEKESLRPETFGSIEELYEIGEIEARVGESDMQSVESGYVEVAGAPLYNLGDRFAGSGPYVSNMTINVDISGIKTTYKLNTWTPEFGTMNKYNINRIADIRKRAFEYAKKQRDRIENPQLPSGFTNMGGGGGSDALTKQQKIDVNSMFLQQYWAFRNILTNCDPEICNKNR